MLGEHCILAGYDSKEQIDMITRGDVVFLYENGVGIIAFGTATGKVQIEDLQGEPDELHLMRLTEFCEIELPVPPGTIKQVQKEKAEKGVWFPKTVQPLDPRTGSHLYELAKKRQERAEQVQEGE